MRVIAGSARGRRLLSPKDMRIRPTQDRVKEAVFSSLMPALPQSRVLDLFAGTGALGIEALSRGAGAVVFLDANREACRLIEKNLALCGWGETAQIRVLHKDTLDWLSGPEAAAQGVWDIILADPPYRQDYGAAVLKAVAKQGILSPGGVLVLESQKAEALPATQGKLALHKTKTYGDTKISYYMIEE